MTGCSEALLRIAALQHRWPAQHPDRIQLYSQPSPNGLKVSMMLEECDLPYEFHRLELGAEGTQSAEYLAANSNGKLPLVVDPSGPCGQPLVLTESNAILLYLADKTASFMEREGPQRYEAISWLFWQASALGPALGQVGYFHKFAGRDIVDRRPLDLHVKEARRLLEILNSQLRDNEWMMGDEFGIVDLSLLGWIRNLIGFYDAAALVGFTLFENLVRWLEAGLSRPAVQRALAKSR